MKFKLFPFEKIEIITTRTAEELSEILKKHVEPKKLLRSEEYRKSFHGDVFENGFKISKVNNFGISLLPVLYGDYLPSNDKTKIVIRFNLNFFVLLFISVWMAPQVFILFALLIGGLCSGDPQFQAMLILIGGILFGWGFSLVLFWPAVNKEKEMIIDLFESYDNHIKVIDSN